MGGSPDLRTTAEVQKSVIRAAICGFGGESDQDSFLAMSSLAQPLDPAINASAATAAILGKQRSFSGCLFIRPSGQWAVGGSGEQAPEGQRVARPERA
jgi:hypothetical protein